MKSVTAMKPKKKTPRALAERIAFYKFANKWKWLLTKGKDLEIFRLIASRDTDSSNRIYVEQRLLCSNPNCPESILEVLAHKHYYWRFLIEKRPTISLSLQMALVRIATTQAYQDIRDYKVDRSIMY